MSHCIPSSFLKVAVLASFVSVILYLRSSVLSLFYYLGATAPAEITTYPVLCSANNLLCESTARKPTSSTINLFGVSPQIRG
ncbi:hypothetical protein P171DRAFT_433497 [Karstenula rhodostoma CBS 690.94]|uniref:Uncharacterized protein n=1 Tax=Karstenula rhodostoma CBS 690.94 TaxID=1392251 RepID=A0A9P4PFI5_9PLEO|nr:hypothetical protein P171DRAFT_433497 [Karstenula rhodostoma CBS 690.94]